MYHCPPRVLKGPFVLIDIVKLTITENDSAVFGDTDASEFSEGLRLAGDVCVSSPDVISLQDPSLFPGPLQSQSQRSSPSLSRARGTRRAFHYSALINYALW